MAVNFCSTTFIQFKMCFDNGMKGNLIKTKIISSICKTECIYFNFKLLNKLISLSQYVKYCKLSFRLYINFIFVKYLKKF
jgi:hypothetical protein